MNPTPTDPREEKPFVRCCDDIITDRETKLAKLAAEIAELKATVERCGEAINLHIDIEATLRAELEAARKEREERKADLKMFMEMHDTALAAKDAAERVGRTARNVLSNLRGKVVEILDYMRGDEAHPPALWRVEEMLTAALTHAPTQEPPADEPKCNCADWGMMDHTSDCPLGIFIRAKYSKATSPAGGVTISTEKKGGDEPCGHESETGSAPAVLLSKSTADATKDTSVASNSPADVPSEGRGECSMCHGFGWIRIGDPGLRCQCKTRLPFNLSDALAGKPVVTRDGRAADGFTRFKYGQWPVRGSVGLWVMKWTEHGEYYGPDRPDHRDLFMLPTEGSGA